MGRRDSKKPSGIKRKRVSQESLQSPINVEVFSEDYLAKLSTEHETAQPYKYAVIQQLCNAESMRKIHEEVKNNMKANFKETDLFKVYQTPDLGALDRATMENMPNLFLLRQELYSEKFRKVIAKITGCDDLTDRVDCSANAYANGCHLLCHDDVIGTRRVSYIIYLSDPDTPWTAEDGGALELYPLDPSALVHQPESEGGTQGIPLSIPTAAVLPTYNTMAFFKVQPGRSYHSVQEVFTQEKPRLSISGWYHGPDAPKGADKASLSQIMTKGDDSRPFETVLPDVAEIVANNQLVKQIDDELTANELKELEKWINPRYLQATNIEDINAQFCEASSIQLKDFICEDIVKELLDSATAADKAELIGASLPQLDYSKGTTDCWKVVGPPHKRRHLLFSNTGKKTDSLSDTVGNQLEQIRNHLMNSEVFLKFLKKLTSLQAYSSRGEVRRFRAGLDYTVAHYGVLTKIPRLDATLCFVDSGAECSNAVDEGGNGSEEQSGEQPSKATSSTDFKNEADIEEKEDDNEDNEDDDDEDDDEDDDIDDDGDAWENGDVGGFECYIEIDDPKESEDPEAAEVYRAPKDDDDDEASTTLLSIPPGNNVLSLVMRDEDIMKFIKYVSANAPGSRWDVAVEYEIVQNNEENEEDD